MLKKGNEVIGLKVISVDNGKVLSTIKDIIYDPKQNRVRGFLVDEGGWFSEAKVILTEDVNNIGPDALMVQSTDLVKKASNIQEKVANIAENGNYLTKTKVITEEGKQLGQITDIYFDTKSGEVEEFEVSQGVVEDVKSGKKRFKISDIITVGEEATIVSGFTEMSFDEQGKEGGLTGTLHEAKDKAQDALENVKSKSIEVAKTTKNNAQEGVEKMKETAQSTEMQERKAKLLDTLGKTKEELKDNLEKAKSKAEVAKDTVSKKYDEHKNELDAKDVIENVKEKIEETKNSAQEKFQDAKSIAEETTKKSFDRVQEERKEKALGKFVQVNLVTKNDSVLAYRGDLITQEMLDLAEKQGVLDQLLSNVSGSPII